MKKFKYPIEAYLKFLKHKRDVVVVEVQKALAYKKSLEEKYEWLEEELKNSYKTNSEFGRGGQNLHYIQDNNKFINLLKVQLQNLSSEIAVAEEKFQEKNNILLEVQMKVKQVETHKEKKQEQFKKEYIKKTTKQFDDINSARKRGA